MTNLRLFNGKIPIQNSGNVDVIILVDFPTKEVFHSLYKNKGYYSDESIEKHYAIVKMRADGNTLADCAKAFGLTRERIRQIEAKFLRKMREYMSSLRTGSL